MLYKKRHREKLVKMAKKYDTTLKKQNNYFNSNNYNNINTQNSNVLNNINSNESIPGQSNITSHIQNVQKVREIPGYYFDYEKNKYFPIKNAHMKSFTEFITEKHKNIIKNENIKINSKEKGKLKENKIPKISNEIKNLSLFQLLRNSKKLHQEEIKENIHYKQKIQNHISEHLFTKEIKHKTNYNKYNLLKFNNKFFIVTLDNNEENTKILIEEIIINGNIFDTVKIRELDFQYRNKTFNSFKLIDNFLIMIFNFELFFIKLDDIFKLTAPEIIYNNFSNIIDFKKKRMPLTFEWPIIKKIGNKKFILLFYKSKLLI
jgi:hypothetical protein